MKNKKNKKCYSLRVIRYATSGYTLIEVLIASAIFAVLITVAVAAFGSNANIQIRSETIRAASQNAKFITEAIARDIRLADTVTLVPGSKIIGTTDKYTSIKISSGGETVTYSFVAPIPNHFGYITYSSSLNPTEAPMLNSENVNVLDKESGAYVSYFQGTDSNVTNLQPQITIDMSFKAVLGTKVIESQAEHIETTVTTRNYPSFYNKYTAP